MKKQPDELKRFDPNVPGEDDGPEETAADRIQ